MPNDKTMEPGKKSQSAVGQPFQADFFPGLLN